MVFTKQIIAYRSTSLEAIVSKYQCLLVVMLDYFAFQPAIFLIICQPQMITKNDRNLYKRGYPSSYIIRTRKFYQAGWSTNICSIATTLLLMAVSFFLTLISIIHDSKDIVKFNRHIEPITIQYQVNKQFYYMIKIRVIIV